MKQAAMLLLTFTLLFTGIAPAGAVKTTKRTEIRLVSLGDSIARGYGCRPEEAYGSLLADYIGELVTPAPYPVRYVNYGTDGDTAGDLLEKLRTREDIREDVRLADILTISIGGNDLIHQLRDLLPKQGDSLLGGVSKLAAALREGLSEARSQEVFRQFQADMDGVFGQLNQLCPDALVILTTIPNPTDDDTLGPIIQRYLERFNNHIRAGCGCREGLIPLAADSNAAFAAYTGKEDLTFTHIDWSDLWTLKLDPHPTPAGHQIIAQTHIPLMEERPTEIRTAWLHSAVPKEEPERPAESAGPERLLPPLVLAVFAGGMLLLALACRRRQL